MTEKSYIEQREGVYRVGARASRSTRLSMPFWKVTLRKASSSPSRA